MPYLFSGDNCPHWKVIDTGNIIVHFQLPETRQEYDIEGLWTELINRFAARRNKS